MLQLFNYFHTIRHIRLRRSCDDILPEIPNHLTLDFRRNLHHVKEFVGRRIAQGRVVLENDETAGRHLASGCGMVVFEHVGYGIPEEIQIGIRKAGLGRKGRGDESVAAV